jgi:acyl dehydratase
VEVGLELATPERRLTWSDIALQVSGSQDWNRVHHDPDAASGAGHDEVFFNTGWTAATMHRVLTDWLGLHGWVRTFAVEMRKMNAPGDLIQAKARVTAKDLEPDGGATVSLDLWIENDRQGVSTRGTAVVTVPR